MHFIEKIEGEILTDSILGHLVLAVLLETIREFFDALLA